MTTEMRKIAMGEITLFRIRKLLAWSRCRGEAVSPDLLSQIVAKRMWADWGYCKLSDFLKAEVGFDTQQIANIVAAAIKGGHEDGKPYGVEQG